MGLLLAIFFAQSTRKKKDNNKAIGSIGLMIGKQSYLDLPENDGEICYCIGVPFWGQNGEK